MPRHSTIEQDTTASQRTTTQHNMVSWGCGPSVVPERARNEHFLIQTRDTLIILDWLFLMVTGERKELGNNGTCSCGRYHLQQVCLRFNATGSQRGLVGTREAETTSH